MCRIWKVFQSQWGLIMLMSKLPEDTHVQRTCTGDWNAASRQEYQLWRERPEYVSTRKRKNEWDRRTLSSRWDCSCQADAPIRWAFPAALSPSLLKIESHWLSLLPQDLWKCKVYSLEQFQRLSNSSLPFTVPQCLWSNRIWEDRIYPVKQ